MANQNISVRSRAEKVSNILKTSVESILDILSENGIEQDENGREILDSVHITIELVQDMLKPYAPSIILRRLAAVALKGDNPHSTAITLVETVGQQNNMTTLLQLRPYEQWSDEELLTEYIASENHDIEFQLNKRAKGRRFIVLGDAKAISVEATLLMLKRARKEDIPMFHTTAEGKAITIHRIEEYHTANRAHHESPFVRGVILFDETCPVSLVNFSGISLRMRQFLRIVVDSSDAPTYAKTSRDYLHTLFEQIKDASSVEDSALAKRYPEALYDFFQKEVAGTLPALRIIVSVDSMTQKADPFQSKSHRVF